MPSGNATGNPNRKRRDFFSGTTLRAAIGIRKQLTVDELNYQRIIGHAHSDCRGFFIYGCMDEVVKASTAMLRWTEFLEEPQDKGVAEPDDELSSYINRTTIEAVYDEQQLWIRKLKEILVDLMLFRNANDQNYYRLFLTYKFLEKYLGFQTDLREFFACESRNVSHSVEYAKKTIARIHKEVDPTKLWFLKPNLNPVKPAAGKIFASARTKLKNVLAVATPDQRLILGITYDRGYSKASRSTHSNIGDPLSSITVKTLDSELSHVAFLSIHIVSEAYKLLGAEPVGEAAKLIAASTSTDFGDNFKAKFSADFCIGDVVMAYGRYLAVVLETKKSPYGYTSCRVQFLRTPMLEEHPEDWFSAPYLNLIAPKQKIIELLSEMLEKQGASTPVEIPEAGYVDLVIKATNQMDNEGFFDRLKGKSRQ